MRAFVELRRAAASYGAIEQRLEELERETQAKLGRHDQQLEAIFRALRQLISPPPRPKHRIGFAPPEDKRRRGFRAKRRRRPLVGEARPDTEAGPVMRSHPWPSASRARAHPASSAGCRACRRWRVVGARGCRVCDGAQGSVAFPLRESCFVGSARVGIRWHRVEVRPARLRRGNPSRGAERHLTSTCALRVR
jgi:hypothetical protein